MGASESTARSNATNDDDQPQQKNNTTGGSSLGAATAIATAAAGVAVTAWGLSKMLSDNTNNQETNNHVMRPSTFLNPREGIMEHTLSSRSSPDRFKMNTDGGCRPLPGRSTGPSGYGGILRDHRGNWVQGIVGFIGESDCLTSEFHGIVKGLELLDKLNIKGAVLETDSQAAYEWVTGQGDHRGKSEIVHACWSIIMKCRQLVDKNDVDVVLVQRGANRCADKMANMAIDGRQQYVVIKDLPDWLTYSFEQDARVNA